MFPDGRCRPDFEVRLDGTERKDLLEGILARFSDSELTMLLDHEDFDGWQDRFFGPYRDRVFALIDYMCRKGQAHWLVFFVASAYPTFTSFATLRTKLTPPLPVDGVLLPGQRDAEAAVHPVVTPAAGNGLRDRWETVLLHDGRPFLDRSSLRGLCRAVGEGGSRPILSVTGPTDTGKSYTGRYLVDVARGSSGPAQLQAREIRLDRLASPLAGGGTGAVDGLSLARVVATEVTDLPLPDFALGSEQDATWAASAAGWIVSNAVSPPLRWLVLDRFESVVLTPSAQAFIDALLDRVSSQSSIRLALLGYPGNLAWCADAVRAAELDLADFLDRGKLTDLVSGFLLELNAEALAKGRAPLMQDELVAEARRVIGTVDPGALSLPKLEAELTKISERVLLGV